MAYIKTDETGRITAASYDFHCGDGEIRVEIPEDVPFARIHDYRYVDEAFVYDPVPEQKESDPVAPRNIMEGEYITVKGVLYKAIANIPSGEPIITGQNAIETTIEEQLAEMAKGE